MDIGRLNETKNFAEKEKARAESELYRTRSRAKELALQIDESNAKAREQKLELQSMRKPEFGDGQYAEVMQELSTVKKELSRLKLDVASALEAKAKAEKETEASRSKASSYSRSVKGLRREIYAANEEHVLVELARIEAEREFRDIEAQRVAEAAQFAKKIEATNKKIKDISNEINLAKELEIKLEITNSDINVLQNEMELVRAMERKHQKNDLFKDANKTIEQRSEEEGRSLLLSAEAELEAAKKELASTKDEGFQFMASLDIIRDEFKNSCVPSRDRLIDTVNFLIRVNVLTEYRQMYLLFPAARRQEPSAEYSIELNDFVPGVDAAVRLDLRVRPPLTSRLPSMVASWLAASTFQKVN